MLGLITFIIFAIGVAYFAIQNTITVPLVIPGYTFLSIPLFMVILGSMLIGTFISWIISLVNDISSGLEIHGKNTALRQAQRDIETLKQENTNLALENERLKGSNTRPVVEKRREEVVYKPSFFERVRESFT